MCTVFLVYQVVPDSPLIVAANRDEFYDRPSQPMHFWEDNPAILAGRDLRAKGTWLGVNKQGRFAVTTNYREPNKTESEFKSRGQLTASFLSQATHIDAFGERLKEEQTAYRGFNLIYGSLNEGLYYFSNRWQKLESLKPGIYGLSNHLLDTPWPKVEKGRTFLTKLGANAQTWTNEKIFKMLGNPDQAPDDELPDTGVGIGWERLLSSMFIETFTYGTRNSTILRFGSNQMVEAEEWSFEKPGSQPQKQHFQLEICS